MVQVLGASCQSPVATYASIEAKNITVIGLVASINGDKVIREIASGEATAARSIGAGLAEKLLEKGARELLKDTA